MSVYSIAGMKCIDARATERLRKAGIRTTCTLLQAAGRPEGRRALAARTGLAPGDLLHWARKAEIMRIHGIGEDYASLLMAVGADSLDTLQAGHPVRLAKAMAEANGRMGLVRQLPNLQLVARWIAEAGRLERLVED